MCRCWGADGAGIVAAVMQTQVPAVQAVQGGPRCDQSRLCLQSGLLSGGMEVQVQKQDLHALTKILVYAYSMIYS